MSRLGASLLVLPMLASASLGAAEAPVVSGMNDFAVASYRQLAGGRGNLILSSWNIAAALSMALAGARGETAADIAATLRQSHPDAGYSAALASLAEQLARDGNAGGNQLLAANNVWIQRGFGVLPEFQRVIEDIFRAPFTPVDFHGEAEQARQQINRWTAERTRNRIQTLFGPGALTGDDTLVLTSAIYFLGKWQTPFRPAATKPEAFYLETGGSVQAPFMRQTGAFGYREDAEIRILEMRYGGTPMAFDILLPKASDGLAALERSLTPEKLSTWLGRLDSRTVDVAIPKFRAESEFDLRKTLSAMGMARAFSGAADFSGIDDRRDLCLSKVVHKAFVDVSEAGTEAAAATGVAVTMIAMAQPPKPVVFRADHPFLFLIRDTRSGAILFEGRLANPK